MPKRRSKKTPTSGVFAKDYPDGPWKEGDAVCCLPATVEGAHAVDPQRWAVLIEKGWVDVDR